MSAYPNVQVSFSVEERELLDAEVKRRSDRAGSPVPVSRVVRDLVRPALMARKHHRKRVG
jgi:hypothetical protein